MLPRGVSMSRLGACALIGGVLLGCAHTKAPTVATRAEIELSELRAQLVERDRVIRELEGRLALATAPRPIEPVAARETVRIAPSQAEPDDRASVEAELAQRSAKAAEPRPLLRLHEKAEPGPVRSLEPVPISSERLRVVALPSAEPSLDAAADDLYLRAIDLVRRREFAAALRELDAFLHSFADDPRSLRALYWRGEVLFAQREYARALESYEGALSRAPDGDRAPDTLLRIARCLVKLGATERARATLAQLTAQFPDSDAARKLHREQTDEDG